MNEGSAAALAGAWMHPRFEVIPIAGLEEQAAYLPRGATVTVTCSPRRGIEQTLLHTERLARRGLRVVPHLSARLVEDMAHLQRIVRRLADLDLREIFVVGGDVQKPVGPFAGALDLIRAMADLEHRPAEIGVAAYPERHPLIDDETLRRVLAEKQAFATYMVTQVCFDPDTIVRWLDGARQQGLELPVYIGVPGVVDGGQLLHVSLKIGVGDSLRFLSKHVNMAATLLKPGRYHPDDVVERLAPYLGDSAYNIRGLHINTFNQVESTEKWRQQKIQRIGASVDAGISVTG